MALWRSPRYKFRVPHDDDGRLKEIALDVTTSAPTFDEPSAGICLALDAALARSPKRAKILDIGAGKLRNTLYLLRQTKHTRIWAVEYERLRESSDQAAKFFAKSGKFKNRFSPTVFPHQFIALKGYSIWGC